MFGRSVPAIAAAGVATVIAVGGMYAPTRAIADDGGGGTGSSATSSADASASASADAGAGAGADTMDVSPTSVAPGGVVTLHLATSCKAGSKAKASADVFVDTVTLAPAGDGSGLEGSAFIRSDAVDGSYAISVECDGVTSSASATITVTTVTTGTTGGTGTSVPDQPLTPVNPVHAGGGGTAQLAAGPAAAGTSTGALLTTGGFAALGLAGLVVHRRRNTRG
jgi:hypothetical protein